MSRADRNMSLISSFRRGSLVPPEPLGRTERLGLPVPLGRPEPPEPLAQPVLRVLRARPARPELPVREPPEPLAQPVLRVLRARLARPGRSYLDKTRLCIPGSYGGEKCGGGFTDKPAVQKQGIIPPIEKPPVILITGGFSFKNLRKDPRNNRYEPYRCNVFPCFPICR